jgi:glycosyltransferase involved in cell wall biosynthesis
MRLVCVSNGPLPYHTPILNRVAKLAELHVVYMSTGHPLNSFRDLWGAEPEFEYSLYRSVALTVPRLDFRTQLSAGISRVLGRHAPDAVFFSSWGPLVWEPVIWARTTGHGSVMWSESTEWSGLARGGVSTSVRRAITGAVDAFVTNGTQATAYLRRLGVPDERIVTSRLPSPLGVESARAGDTASPAYLFVGRLIPRKRPHDALDAFREVLPRYPDATLAFVGDGPLEHELRAAAAGLGEAVVFRGRLEGESLAAVLAAADVLVLPAAREVWGLVVNEALASGLYVVASDEVGSAHDLLTPESGEIVPVGDRSALVAALLRAAGVDFGDGARADRNRSVAGITPQAFAEDLVSAAEVAAGSRRRRRGRARA